MAAYIFAIVGMLIVIPILSFLPLNFSNRGTIIIAGIAFIAALLFILLQSVLDIWTALLAGIAIILISSIVLQRKGESFMLETAVDEGDPEYEDSEIEEEPETISHSDDLVIEEDADIVLHKEPWMESEAEIEQKEINESFAKLDAADHAESAIEQEELNQSEESELSEMLKSRQQTLLEEQAEITAETDELTDIETETITETAETLNVNDTDRSWLESAAAFEGEEAVAEDSTFESAKESGEELSEPILSPDEKSFFNNLVLEEDDLDVEQENAEPSDRTPAEESDLLEEPSVHEDTEADVEAVQAEETQLEINEETENLTGEDQFVITENRETDQAGELETDIELAEAPFQSQMIDEQIFHLITSEFEADQNPDISALENEIRETLKLTTDPSQQYVLYRILIEQLIKQEHIPEVLSLSEEVTQKFNHDFIRNEMNELRSIL